MTDIEKIIGWPHHSHLFMSYEHGLPTLGADVFDRGRPLSLAALLSQQDWQMRGQK